MTNQNPDFTQPPWVQSPSEVMDWINATHPSKKTKGKKHLPSGEKILWNLHVRLDFNVEQKKVPSPNIFSKFITKITIVINFIFIFVSLLNDFISLIYRFIITASNHRSNY